jgi:hypothetical protein
MNKIKVSPLSHAMEGWLELLSEQTVAVDFLYCFTQISPTLPEFTEPIT